MRPEDNKTSYKTNYLISVADPDPPDPGVFGPPESGSGSISQWYGSVSGSFYHYAKIVRKPLDFYCFVTSLRLFTFEQNDVKVPS